ncbi:hypothetical protein FACS1894151_05420 [Spirochaetia bacterium]|nr:hypothetical protein FACS1894151_05420 [Spirochaetia bacterium]
MTQELLIEEVKRIRDPEVIAALYSYTLFCTSRFAKADVSSTEPWQADGKPHSWKDIVPIKAKSNRSTKEMIDWVRK